MMFNPPTANLGFPMGFQAHSPGRPRPKAGYKCKICGKPGGKPDSHWYQLCPSRGTPDDQRPFNPPRKGYICKFCHKQGGEKDSHWFQQCPKRAEFEGIQVPHPLKVRGLVPSAFNAGLFPSNPQQQQQQQQVLAAQAAMMNLGLNPNFGQLNNMGGFGGNFGNMNQLQQMQQSLSNMNSLNNLNSMNSFNNLSSLNNYNGGGNFTGGNMNQLTSMPSLGSMNNLSQFNQLSNQATGSSQQLSSQMYSDPVQQSSQNQKYFEEEMLAKLNLTEEEPDGLNAIQQNGTVEVADSM